MTQGFDEWMNKNHSGAFDMPHQRDAYEAGAASRQAEIDDSENTRAVLYRENMDLRENNIELQKRIDKALYKLPWLNWKNIGGKMKGEIMDILKGKKDE